MPPRNANSDGPRASIDLLTRARAFAPAFVLALAAAGLAAASDGPSAGDAPAPSAARKGAAGRPTVDYAREIKPILTRHCVECHGAARPRAGLRLDTAAAALKGGKHGPAVLPGRGEDSPLVLAARGEGDGEQMPLNRPPLDEAVIQRLQDWIDQGARGTANERPGRPPKKTHWAFVPPVRPRPPDVAAKMPGWPRNPIDQFVLARLEQAKLAPSPEAAPAALLRRAGLDAIGLPPAPEELDAFLADQTPGRFERAIDRLLASPHFGERWARPWLDQARYADSNGFNIDAPRSIWKYRDWVIAAFNRNMPFDQFVIDQIAGDLRPGATIDQRVATGFHRNTPLNQEGGIDVEQFRVESIVDRVNTTGTVFLGLTVGCAQCHDHKYDPVLQREYYQLFAFFNNVDEPALALERPGDEARRRAVAARADKFHKELAKRWPDLDERERRWEATIALEFIQGQTQEVRTTFDTPREKRTASQRRAMVELMLAKSQDEALKAERSRLRKLKAASPKPLTTLVVAERSGDPRPTFVHLGGDFTRKGDPVAPGVPAVLPPLIAGATGRSASDHRPDRMDLARWLVDRRNPLTARVAVNRIWQAYFGRGLVETDNDFGTQGSPPSHPELLDWLACELMDRNWDLRAIHRLVLGSATYRQSSRSRPEGRSIDPDNRLLWRQSRFRLEAELIRDSALLASGLLTRRLGGPSVHPPQPEGVMTLGQMKRPWAADTGPNRYRRGLYTFFWRATPYPFLTTFDAPGGVESCTRRLRSDTPLQALTLLNGPAFIEIAEGLAARIIEEEPGPGPSADRRRLERAFRLCLSRAPSERELRTLETLLARERAERGPSAAATARPSKTPNAPPPLPEWTTVARVLMNLDEFMTRE